MTTRIGVITFPGSLDDRDAQRAIEIAGATPVALWHGSHDLDGVDALVLPGGFSYGDYLRAGSIAALAPIMVEVKAAAAKGMPVLGICNGFQMLVEAHLLPGGLIRNAHQQFIRRDQRLVVESTSTAWTSDFTTGQEIVIPLKNADGGYIAADDELDRLEGEGLVAFRYAGVNPNGSLRDIAGIANDRGNVVGLMPHPEHAVEEGFGPNTPAAMRSGIDGLGFFTSAIAAVVGAAA
ncbi:phosphoribosylformylglycinamidine synthase subunit PurQ [Microbacterium sp. R86528]|uniref:phosphoribosylformylglycinamidine synthase subunit PurQ n=1 Tax=Microbacterium sp. R86528 TaxID=3093864 RepID=UPI0037CAF4D1